MAHCNEMICQQVTLSGYAEWPKVADAVIEAYLTLQRHFSALTKFSRVESRFYGRKERGKAAFDIPINPCVRGVCSKSVAVGLILSYP
jgi:hypothetical protein